MPEHAYLNKIDIKRIKKKGELKFVFELPFVLVFFNLLTGNRVFVVVGKNITGRVSEKGRAWSGWPSCP